MSATKQWFVLRVGTNREKRVKKQLNSRIAQNDLGELISEILVVTERVTEIKAGNRRTVERKVYPGYVMAEIVVDDETGEIPRRLAPDPRDPWTNQIRR